MTGGERPPLRHFLRQRPATLIASGYALGILAGWALLALLPVTLQPTAALDHLFIAASAVTTTGLTTVTVAGTYTFGGQVILLALIQVFGVGYMGIASFVVLARQHSLSTMQRSMLSKAFSLPEGFSLRSLVRSVVWYTVGIEAAGTAVLFWIFREAGVEQPAWAALFHSISSFCTAGFSPFASSLQAFRDNTALNVTIALLSYAGAMGFIVMIDVWRRLTRRDASMSRTSEVIVGLTLAISLIGFVVLFFTEPALRALDIGPRLLGAFFQSMTALSTVGFNTMEVSTYALSSQILLILLMILGASPSGTGGGVKTTTTAAMLAFVRQGLTGAEEAVFLGQNVPAERARTAAAAFAFYVLILTAGLYALTLAEPAGLGPVAFEAVSALGTVGLSLGLTPELTGAGKLIIVVLMFAGRLGPVTFGAMLFHDATPHGEASEGEEDLAV